MQSQRGQASRISPAWTALVFRIRLRSTTPTMKPGQIVFAWRVSVRQFGGFAAHEGAAGLMAGAGHALDQLLDDVGIHAAHRQIIEKKQRLGAQGENVVHAVIHEIARPRWNACPWRRRF